MFERQSRELVPVIKGVPGPGSYFPNLAQNAQIEGYKQIAMKQRYNARNSSSTPGPGAYGTARYSSIRSRNPSIIIGTGPRTSIMKEQIKVQSVNPAPNVYSQTVLGIASEGKKKNKYSFARTIRDTDKIGQSTPGPGSYLLPTKFANVQPYQIPTSKRITQV